MPRKSTIATMSVASVAAGLVRLTLANPPEFQAGRVFGEAAGLVGIFFGILGLFQLVWWTAVAYRPGNKPIVTLGIVVFTFSILIYLLATVTPLPLGVPQLRINQFPLLTKVLELIYIIGSISILKGEK
jgi:hypothetical protein